MTIEHLAYPGLVSRDPALSYTELKTLTYSLSPTNIQRNQKTELVSTNKIKAPHFHNCYHWHAGNNSFTKKTMMSPFLYNRIGTTDIKIIHSHLLGLRHSGSATLVTPFLHPLRSRLRRQSLCERSEGTFV